MNYRKQTVFLIGVVFVFSQSCASSPTCGAEQKRARDFLKTLASTAALGFASAATASKAVHLLRKENAYLPYPEEATAVEKVLEKHGLSADKVELRVVESKNALPASTLFNTVLVRSDSIADQELLLRQYAHVAHKDTRHLIERIAVATACSAAFLYAAEGLCDDDKTLRIAVRAAGTPLCFQFVNWAAAAGKEEAETAASVYARAECERYATEDWAVYENGLAAARLPQVPITVCRGTTASYHVRCESMQGNKE